MCKKLNDFFLLLKEIKTQQEDQKKRGFNDYNILTTVLKETDEVRLHSRMIASLLDVNGEHYQGSLFFHLFLKELKLPDFSIDVSRLEVKTEYECIDIYMTDGSKHIILENKIYAQDAEMQIQRYVENIMKKDPDIKADDILVLYLSIDRDSPSMQSLGDMIVHNGILSKNKQDIAFFRAIKYKDFILPWLEKCHKEIQNIVNLNFALLQYTDVVRKITKLYRRKIMSLTEVLKHNKESYCLAQEIVGELPKFKNDAVKSFFHKIKNELVLDNSWECYISEDFSGFKEKLYLLIVQRDQKTAQQVALAFSFEGSEYRIPYFGVTIVERSGNWFKNLNSLEIRKSMKKMEFDNEERENEYWFPWKKYPSQSDFVEYILDDESGEQFVRVLGSHLEKWKQIIEEVNLIIKQQNG